mmetsp:Transcript_20120/g.69060  ORF Transcript_20120/g.69060 Transcript_20120/m.69060 type:complete len:209 (+) Transcript_20120:1523-2149(+)
MSAVSSSQHMFATLSRDRTAFSGAASDALSDAAAAAEAAPAATPEGARHRASARATGASFTTAPASRCAAGLARRVAAGAPPGDSMSTTAPSASRKTSLALAPGHSAPRAATMPSTVRLVKSASGSVNATVRPCCRTEPAGKPASTAATTDGLTSVDSAISSSGQWHGASWHRPHRRATGSSHSSAPASGAAPGAIGQWQGASWHMPH